MAKGFQAVRGMADILPDVTPEWSYVEAQFRSVMARYAYQEIRLPILEPAGVYQLSIGEATDIVQKEMYEFEDRNGDRLALRPEGTVGCVRACLQHGLLHNQVQRLWYAGPMFRHERPQKGRYRQFHQFGVEAYGLSGIGVEAELLSATAVYWELLGLEGSMTLQLGTLGTVEERSAYRDVLQAYWMDHQKELSADVLTRAQTNPLRVLDSKDPDLQALIETAPILLDHLTAESVDRFEKLCALLTEMGVAFEVNTRLVRGLDYYNQTVFEWVSRDLGSQGTVCAGGRYDDLVRMLGGRPTPAVGFALGVERLLLLRQQKRTADPDVSLILVGDRAQDHGVVLADALRRACPDVNWHTQLTGSGFRSQLKSADKIGARWAVIVGDDECESQQYGVKNLREDVSQVSKTLSEMIEFFNDKED